MSNLNDEDVIMRHNSKIFETIGNLGNISEAQRVAKIHEHYNKLEKVAVRSVKSTKYAICSIIELTNRLGSISMTSIIHVSAIDKARHRHQKHTFKNSSPLNYLKQKVDNESDNIAFRKSEQKKSRTNCRVCRDKFKEPATVYSGHKSNSSKCPHNNNMLSSLSNNAQQEQVSTTNNDSNNDSMPYTNKDTVDTDKDSLNKKKQVSVSSRSTSSNADDSSSHSSNNDNSVYTTATTISHRDHIFGYDRTRTNEPICPGDVIQYYDPIYVTGDKWGLHKATVLAVNPKDSMPLVLSNGEGIPKTCTLKRIKIIKNNVLVDHSNGLFWSMDSFKLRKSGTAKLSDIMAQEGKRLSGILKEHIKTGMEKCKANGFALEDIIIEKLACSDETDHDTSEDRNLFYSQDCTVSSNYSIRKSDPIPQIIPPDSVEEAIKIVE